MKVLLVNMKGVYPPIGLGYLASVLEKKGVGVEILDCGGLGYSDEQLFSRVECEVEERTPDVLGVGCFTTVAHLAYRVAQIAKKIHPNCFTVLGGPHPSADPVGSCSPEGVDASIVGEGEGTLSELVSTLEMGRDLSHVDGLVWKDMGRVRSNRPRDLIQDLDLLPYPAYPLFPDFKLELEIDAHGILTRRHPYMPIFSSRGCPFNCIYCHRIFGKIWRARSPKNVVDEIEYLWNKYGTEEIHFEDDNFNLNIDRAARICDEIVGRGLDLALKFPNGIRADYVNEELIIKLKRAGCYSISIGIETASKRVMQLIKKNLDLEKVEATIDLARKHGLQVRGFFMIGFPTETKEEIQRTVEFARKSRLHFASFSIATPYCGSALHDMVRELGYLDEEKAQDRFFFGNPVIRTPEFNEEELLKMREQAQTSFYEDSVRQSLLAPMDFSPAEVLDYYTSPIYDYHSILLMNNFGGYRQTIPSFYKRKDKMPNTSRQGLRA